MLVNDSNKTTEIISIWFESNNIKPEFFFCILKELLSFDSIFI